MSHQTNHHSPASGSRSSIFPTLSAGVVNAAMVVVIEVAFAALIFSGPLGDELPLGVGLTLFGAFVIGVVMALTSSFTETVALPQEAPVAILALMIGEIVALMGAVSREAVVSTIVVAIALTTVITGVVYLLLGAYKLGRLIRFVPFPVVGGFLAGTGWLFVPGALSVLTGEGGHHIDVGHLFTSHALMQWIPGALFAVVMLIASRRATHYFVLPGLLVGATALFYLVLLITGTSIDQASAGGWLLGPFPQSPQWHMISSYDLGLVRWDLIAGEWPKIATIPIVSVVSLLLYASGMELTSRRESDINRELKGAGLANLLAGLGGSPPGFHTPDLAAIAYRMNANGRVAGVLAATLCGALLFVGADLVSYFPRPIVGGLLLFLGLTLMAEWLYEGWFRLSRADYVVVLMIVVIMATVGYLEGAVAGLVVAVVLFVAKYSRISIVKTELSGRMLQSNVERDAVDRELLRARAEEVTILKLHGYLFFGTAHGLLERIRERVNDRERPRLHYMVLDFRLVSGMDSSALNSFQRIRQLADTQGFKLILASVPAAMARQLEHSWEELEKEGHGGGEVLLFSDLDHALEHCENQILAAAHAHRAGGAPSFADQLAVGLGRQELADAVMSYLEIKTLPKGEALIRQGEENREIYFIERGEVTAQLDGEDGVPIRLRTMGPGTVVGEMSLYLGSTATATVVAHEQTTYYGLTAAALQSMEAERPDAAIALHRLIARRLGERLLNANNTLQALLE